MKLNIFLLFLVIFAAITLAAPAYSNNDLSNPLERKYFIYYYNKPI